MSKIVFRAPLLVSLCALLFGVLPACHKAEGPTGSTNHATITVHSPAEGAAILPGATVQIRATIEAIEPLHGYELFIRNKATGEKLLSADEHSHGSTIEVSKNWVNTAAAGTELELEIAVSLDHDGNIHSKKVVFRAQ